MTEDHPIVAHLRRLDLHNLAALTDQIAESIVWHYSNPNMLDVQGDYVGLEGVRAFFEAIAQKSGGTFRIDPISVTPVGSDLVVLQSRDTLTFDGRSVAVNVVVVWRIVDGHVVEVWDIVPGDAKEVQNDGR